MTDSMRTFELWKYHILTKYWTQLSEEHFWFFWKELALWIHNTWDQWGKMLLKCRQLCLYLDLNLNTWNKCEIFECLNQLGPSLKQIIWQLLFILLQWKNLWGQEDSPEVKVCLSFWMMFLDWIEFFITYTFYRSS